MLCWKMQFLLNISSPSSWIWKSPRQKGAICLTQTFWAPTSLCYLQKCSFCPISPLQVVIFEQFQDKSGSFFFSRQTFWVSTAIYYLEKCSFAPYILARIHWTILRLTGGSFFSHDEHFQYPQPYVKLKNAVFAPYLLSMYLDLKNPNIKWGHLFETNILSTNTPILSWKMQLLFHMSPPSSQVSKIPRQRGGVIFRQTFWCWTALCYLEKCGFCPISPLQVVRFEKFQDKRGMICLEQTFWVPTPLCYLENAVVAPYLLSK